jgi:predicted Mrr-cat superfamily restriction endonuclease
MVSKNRVRFDHSVAIIGCNEIHDISKINDKAELEELYLKYHPNTKKMNAARMIWQIWYFAKEIKKGDDIIALLFKSQSSIVLGSVEGDYEFKEIKYLLL